MKQDAMNWIDPAALLISLCIPIFLAMNMVRKAEGQVKGVAVYFLFFGPLTIFVGMFFHLLEIVFRASVAYSQGKFTYDFRFYALILMGVLLANLSFQLLKAASAKCLKVGGAGEKYVRNTVYIVLVSTPTIFLTPIGALPLLACCISLAALPFLYTKKRIIRPVAVRRSAFVAEPA